MNWKWWGSFAQGQVVVYIHHVDVASQIDENNKVMPNSDGRRHPLDRLPARALSTDIALLSDNDDEVFVTEWDDSIQNCGNGWVRTYIDAQHRIQSNNGLCFL